MAEEKETKKEEKKSVVEKAKEIIEKKNEKPKVVEEKIELQREYVVPLRKGFSKVPKYRRAKKAILVLKQFIAKHMKVENRDLRKVKISNYLNNEIWFRGIKKPLHKIKVKAIKKSGEVLVELAEIPEQVKFAMQKHQKVLKKINKSELKKLEDKKPEEKKEESTDTKEKEKASAEQGLKNQKAEAKAQKQTAKVSHEKKVMPRRQVMQK